MIENFHIFIDSQKTELDSSGYKYLYIGLSFIYVDTNLHSL